MRHLPNIICLIRIGLIWPILRSLEQGNYQITLALFFVAAMSDGLDGFLAKRFGWTSRLGKVLDPAADKLLLVSVFLVATWLGLIPRWLTAAAVGRDFMIILGAIAYRVGIGPLHGRPIVSSKINTLLQLLYVLLIVGNAAYGLPPHNMLDALAYLTLLSIVISGYGYVREYAGRALELAA
jgi:cardiolipin synthase (CMP-forming)